MATFGLVNDMSESRPTAEHAVEEFFLGIHAEPLEHRRVAVQQAGGRGGERGKRGHLYAPRLGVLGALPATTTLRLKQSLLKDFRVSMNPSPLFATGT